MIPRRTLLAALLAVPTPAGAQQPAELPPADRAAIQGVIAAQIDAFRRDDGDAAFAYASPMIHGMFGSAARFMAMVRGLYQPVYRPRFVAFGPLLDIDGRLVQKVELIGPDGAPALALYTMVRTPGGWRIDGVMLADSENPAT